MVYDHEGGKMAFDLLAGVPQSLWWPKLLSPLKQQNKKTPKKPTNESVSLRGSARSRVVSGFRVQGVLSIGWRCPFLAEEIQKGQCSGGQLASTMEICGRGRVACFRGLNLYRDMYLLCGSIGGHTTGAWRIRFESDELLGICAVWYFLWFMTFRWLLNWWKFFWRATFYILSI